MKSSENDPQLATWLAAEAAGRDEDAQAALHQLFRCLPRARPSAHFADRVLRLSGHAPPRRSRQRSRWLLAAAVLVSISLPWLSLTARLAPSNAGGLVVTGVNAVLAASGWLDRLHSVFEVLGHLRQACLAVAGMPQVALIALLSLLISALSLRGLATLTHRTGSANYA